MPPARKTPKSSSSSAGSSRGGKSTGNGLRNTTSKATTSTSPNSTERATAEPAQGLPETSRGKRIKGKRLPVTPTAKKGKKKTFNSYGHFLYKVLKQVHPDCGISTRAMAVMDSFMMDIFDRIATEASTLMKKSGKMTLSSRDIQAGTRLVLSGELCKHAVSEGTKAITKYFDSQKTVKK